MLAHNLEPMNDLGGGIHRTVALLRLLATPDGRGLRLKDIADAREPSATDDASLAGEPDG